MIEVPAADDAPMQSWGWLQRLLHALRKRLYGPQRWDRYVCRLEGKVRPQAPPRWSVVRPVYPPRPACAVCGDQYESVTSVSGPNEAERVRLGPCGHEHWSDPGSPGGLVPVRPTVPGDPEGFVWMRNDATNGCARSTRKALTEVWGARGWHYDGEVDPEFPGDHPSCDCGTERAPLTTRHILGAEGQSICTPVLGGICLDCTEAAKARVDAHPTGIITVPGSLTEAEAEDLRRRWIDSRGEALHIVAGRQVGI